MAADPPAASTSAAPNPPIALPCPGAQRCGAVCIPWTEVCRDTLANSVGLVPPPVQSAESTAAAAGVPVGSTLVGLPSAQGARPPTMKPGAPAFCYDGKTTHAVSVQIACVPFYVWGDEPTINGVGPVESTCLVHLRCNGECLQPGQTCPDLAGDFDSSRLKPLND